MLPNMLGGLRLRLRAMARRAPDEQRLLDELEALDRKLTDKSMVDDIKESIRYGPAEGSCPCCGASV